MAEKVSVTASVLREVLVALTSSGPEIRELQFTRNLPGGGNAIDKLIEEFNAEVTPKQRPQPRTHHD